MKTNNPTDQHEELQDILDHLDHLDLIIMKVGEAVRSNTNSGINVLAEFRLFCEAGLADKIRAILPPSPDTSDALLEQMAEALEKSNKALLPFMKQGIINNTASPLMYQAEERNDKVLTAYNEFKDGK